MSAFLNEWPMERPKDWIELVNGSETDTELGDLRLSRRVIGRYGNENWVIRIAKQLGFEWTMNSRGRPKGT
ncbi:MAG: hypothetical protein GEU77_15075 [Deltaproteobacteria bacterium]|nr:hypothetical protein [Deltaproteobacteria bacterium]